MIDILKTIFGLIFIFLGINGLLFASIAIYDMFLFDYEYKIFKFLTKKIMDLILFVTGLSIVYSTSACLIIYIIVQGLEKQIK